MPTVNLTKEEAWKIFLLWYKNERASAFVPSKSGMLKIAKKFGISKETFDNWAYNKQWQVNENGKEI